MRDAREVFGVRISGTLAAKVAVENPTVASDKIRFAHARDWLFIQKNVTSRRGKAKAHSLEHSYEPRLNLEKVGLGETSPTIAKRFR